jgi:hypothetical protein
MTTTPRIDEYLEEVLRGMRLRQEAEEMFELLQRADSQGYFEKAEERERVRAVVRRVLGLTSEPPGDEPGGEEETDD